MLEQDPTFVPALTVVEAAFRARRMFKEAAVARLSVDSTSVRSSLERVVAASGYRGLMTFISQQDEDRSAREYISPYFMAYYHAAAGEPDRALPWLEKAFEQGHPALVLLAIEPVYDAVRQNGTFRRIEAGIGLRPDDRLARVRLDGDDTPKTR